MTAPSVPELGSTDFDGMAFEERVNGAIQAIYDQSAPAGDTDITDAVFSRQGTIAIWALMNVKDFELVPQRAVHQG